jgi:hypothetical protein
LRLTRGQVLICKINIVSRYRFYSDFLRSGHARRSRVTALTRFSSERVCEMLSRYRFDSIFFRAGTRDVLALPLYLDFLPSGHARRSRVTALSRFSPERVCETLSRYRFDSIFFRAGMRDALALPLYLDFLPSGHARRSRVTALTRFSSERACETFSRYRLPLFFGSSGMQDALALPPLLGFFPSGYARRSRVTACLFFSEVRA